MSSLRGTYSRMLETCRRVLVLFAYPLAECALSIVRLLLLWWKLISTLIYRNTLELVSPCGLFCFWYSSVSLKTEMLSMSSAYGISALPSILSGEENSELTWLCHILQVKCWHMGHGKCQRVPWFRDPQSCSRPWLLRLECCQTHQRTDHEPTCFRIAAVTGWCHTPPCPPSCFSRKLPTALPWGRGPYLYPQWLAVTGWPPWPLPERWSMVRWSSLTFALPLPLQCKGWWICVLERCTLGKLHQKCTSQETILYVEEMYLRNHYIIKR